MAFDPDRHRRRSIRYCGYDYAPDGAYYETICVQDRLCLFGEVVEGDAALSEAGLMVERLWWFLPRRIPSIDVDVLVVMPNHFHEVVVLGANPEVSEQCFHGEGRHGGLPLRPGGGVAQADREVGLTLGQVMHWFKTITVSDYIAGVHHMDWRPFNRRLWQRNYYERIVRSDRELDLIRAYIETNPAKWPEDAEHPSVQPVQPASTS